MKKPNLHSPHKSPYETIVIVLALLAFIVLAVSVKSQPIFFDSAFLHWIHLHATHFYDSVFLFFTTLGSAAVLGPVTVLAVILLWVRKRRYDAVFLLCCVAGASVANVILKTLFHRVRPSLWHPSVLETSYSFPSGHAMSSSAVALAVVIILWDTRWRWPAIIFGSLFVLAVGYSRLYLGVHYPSDVMGGWCASTVLVLGIAKLLHHFKTKRPLKDIL
ncbi:MAG: acid phosphatase [Candidatus Saccharibacteria bacterium]|nr:acid phosphatase [Candidatus Saccharibacteria bacterium]